MSVAEQSEPSLLASSISCHCWNGDKSMLALCPGNKEIHIYAVSGAGENRTYERRDVLVEHDQLVSGIDWSPTTNRIVSVSHDRNAYVWNLVEGRWKPDLVVLKGFNRAVTCVKWSPNEDKFAIGSSSGHVGVCFWEGGTNNWWVSRTFRGINASILGVGWHPSQLFLAVASADNRVVVFSAAMKKIDKKQNVPPYNVMSCGEIVAEHPTQGWPQSVGWSPDGSWLGYVSQDSSISFVNQAQAGLPPQKILLSNLPFRTLLFVSPTAVVAAGHDCNPFLFTLSGPNWTFARKLDPETRVVASKTQIQAVFDKWEINRGQGSSTLRSNPGAGPKDGSDKWLRTKHQSCITSLIPVAASDMNVTQFSSCGTDGRINVWVL